MFKSSSKVYQENENEDDDDITREQGRIPSLSEEPSAEEDLHCKNNTNNNNNDSNDHIYNNNNNNNNNKNNSNAGKNDKNQGVATYKNSYKKRASSLSDDIFSPVDSPTKNKNIRSPMKTTKKTRNRKISR